MEEKVLKLVENFLAMIAFVFALVVLYAVFSSLMYPSYLP